MSLFPMAGQGSGRNYCNQGAAKLAVKWAVTVGKKKVAVHASARPSRLSVVVPRVMPRVCSSLTALNVAVLSRGGGGVSMGGGSALETSDDRRLISAVSIHHCASSTRVGEILKLFMFWPSYNFRTVF